MEKMSKRFILFYEYAHCACAREFFVCLTIHWDERTISFTDLKKNETVMPSNLAWIACWVCSMRKENAQHTHTPRVIQYYYIFIVYILNVRLQDPNKQIFMMQLNLKYVYVVRFHKTTIWALKINFSKIYNIRLKGAYCIGDRCHQYNRHQLLSERQIAISNIMCDNIQFWYTTNIKVCALVLLNRGIKSNWQPNNLRVTLFDK